MKTIIVRAEQSLLDVAIEQYGDARAVVWIVEDNARTSIVDNVYAGEKLLIRDEVMDVEMVRRAQAVGVATLADKDREKGISYMRVGVDFIPN